MLHQLEQADVFYDLDTEQLEKVQAICTRVTLEKDTVIFEENSPGDKMYVVIRGAIDVRVDPKTLGLETDTEPTTIATLRHGQAFGEIVLVDQGLRSASAQVASKTAQLFVIKRDDLISLCEQDYKLGYLIMRNIAAEMAFKIRGTDLIVREQLLWRPRA